MNITDLVVPAEVSGEGAPACDLGSGPIDLLLAGRLASARRLIDEQAMVCAGAMLHRNIAHQRRSTTAGQERL